MAPHTAKKSQLGTIFIITLLNMIGFGIIIPMLPYYASGFGADPGTVGLLIGSYAAAQFAGAPLWGRLSDNHGRRNILLITIAIASVGYVLFGIAQSVLMLFISRILTGFMNGNISVIQAYVTDITAKEERAKGYGILGAAFGLGLVTGPALGGFFSNWGYGAASFAAAVLNLLSMIAVYIFLPAIAKDKRLDNKSASFSIDALILALKRPHVGNLLKTRFVFGISFSTFTTIFVLFAEYGLKLSAQETAWLLTYVGLLMVIVQGLLVDKMAYYLSEGKLLFYSIALMAVSLLGWAFVRSIPPMLILLIPFALAGGVFNTIINSSLSKMVQENEVGGMLGVSASLESFTRIIAPSLGGYLLQKIGIWAPGIMSALVLFMLAPFAYSYFIQKPHSAIAEPNPKPQK